MPTELTACRDCLHYRNTGSVAYESVCVVSPRWRFSAFRGERYQDGFLAIHEVNLDGACPKFQASTTVVENS